ncbi:hypothetical protein Tco_1506585 [Tanacetum coccineum]
MCKNLKDSQSGAEISGLGVVSQGQLQYWVDIDKDDDEGGRFETLCPSNAIILRQVSNYAVEGELAIFKWQANLSNVHEKRIRNLQKKRINNLEANNMILQEKPVKKPAARRQSAGVQIRDTPGVSVSKKKAPAKAKRSKGIELLSEATSLEEAQLKKAIKRSKQETNIHQAGGLSEGADLELEVPDEPKGKSIDISGGTGDSDNDDDDDDDQQSNDERTESDDDKSADLNKTDEEEEDEFDRSYLAC